MEKDVLKEMLCGIIRSIKETFDISKSDMIDVLYEICDYINYN